MITNMATLILSIDIYLLWRISTPIAVGRGPIPRSSADLGAVKAIRKQTHMYIVQYCTLYCILCCTSIYTYKVTRKLKIFCCSLDHYFALLHSQAYPLTFKSAWYPLTFFTIH